MENENLVTCKICGKQSTRIYGRHLKSHGLTSDEYLKLYPGAPLYTESDNKKTTINSGQHMKQEKYKKMFSEMIKGEKNPNHKSRTTEEERKQKSPFSKSFVKYKNESEADAFQQKVSKSIGPEKRPTKVEYWIKRGHTEEESEKIISKNQVTFSLDICIEKFGEIEGKKRWMDRQEKWLKNYKKNNFSAVSQKLFWSIYEKLKNKEEIYFATLSSETTDFTGGNNEYRLRLKNSLVLPDFFMKNENKIIEFDGTYYHRDNPENKKRSLIRDEELISDGFKVFHVSESDYKKSPDKILSKCLEFLK